MAAFARAVCCCCSEVHERETTQTVTKKVVTSKQVNLIPKVKIPRISLTLKQDVLRNWFFQGLFRPHDVIYHKGKYIITDSGHRLITSYDPKTGSHDTVCKIWRSWLFGLASLSDTNRGFLVVDNSKGRVYRINGTSKYDWMNGMESPTGITVHGGEVFVADSKINYVEVYDENGKYRRRFGNEFLRSPWFLAVNSKGLLYVTDSQDINVFTTAGEYKTRFKLPSNNKTWYYRGITIDRYDNLYITARDSTARGANETITVLDSSHKPVVHYTGGINSMHYLRGLCINYDRNELVVVDGEWHRLKLFKLYA